MGLSTRTVSFTRSAMLSREGDVVHGSGTVAAQHGAFSVSVRFPSRRGEPEGTTTPEELLAASHAACYGIGLRSVIGRMGGSAERISVTATLTAEKGPEGIRVLRSQLDAIVEGLVGLSAQQLADSGNIAERECTVSTVLRGSAEVSHIIRDASHEHVS